MNPLAQTASFLSRSPERFKAPSTQVRMKKMCGFNNVRIRVDMSWGTTWAHCYVFILKRMHKVQRLISTGLRDILNWVIDERVI